VIHLSPADSSHQKTQVRGQCFPFGGIRLQARGQVVTDGDGFHGLRLELLPRRFRCAASGPALRVGLPSDDLGFRGQGLRLAAEAVATLAGTQSFSSSLQVIAGSASSHLEFPMTANTCHGQRPGGGLRPSVWDDRCSQPRCPAGACAARGARTVSRGRTGADRHHLPRACSGTASETDGQLDHPYQRSNCQQP